MFIICSCIVGDCLSEHHNLGTVGYVFILVLVGNLFVTNRILSTSIRPSGERLVALLRRSLEIMGTKCIDYGVYRYTCTYTF